MLLWYRHTMGMDEGNKVNRSIQIEVMGSLPEAKGTERIRWMGYIHVSDGNEQVHFLGGMRPRQ